MEKATVVGIVIGSVALGAVLGAGTMQAMGKKSFDPAAAQCALSSGMYAPNQPILTLEGKSVSAADLPLSVQGDLTRIQNQAYEQMTGYLKEVALRMILAKEKGKDVSNPPQLLELLDDATVTEQEVNAILDAQKKNLPAGMKIEEAKKQIEMYLKRQKAGGAVEKKLAEVEQSGKFKLLLTAPAGKPVNTEGQPTKGAANAAVKVVVVTDFLCGHCRHRAEEIEQAVTDHGSKVQFVRMTFALQPEGLSGALARGGFCANKQNPELYWKYHAGAEKVPLEAAHAGHNHANNDHSNASPDTQKEFNNHALGVAKDAGLDVSAFEKCLTSPEAQDFVRKTNDTLAVAGVSGTPTFFVNGRLVQVAPGQLSAFVKEAVANTAK
jgi:protein-disulfide isomerase